MKELLVSLVLSSPDGILAKRQRITELQRLLFSPSQEGGLFIGRGEGVAYRTALPVFVLFGLRGD